jgi:single-strand DNA-binding protein
MYHDHKYLNIMLHNVKNSIQIVGHVGKDIILTSFENGNKKAIAIVATNEIYTEKNGEKVKQTVWHKVIAWGKKADELALSFKKGTKVAIHGKLANKTYTDSKGTTRCVTEIVATEFYKIEKATKHTAEAVPF